MAKMTVYDMIRAKAKSMGHNAANIPDKVLESYVQQDARQMTLLGAKLYMENYMMGNIDPADFANVLAANDQLRYTVSDLCRMKLEPRELNVQRNSSYIDVGAGLKTFWSEMRVPLPSEQQAARDLRNITLGIEAGRRGQQPVQAGAEQNNSAVLDNVSPTDAEVTVKKRRSVGDVLNGAKQRAAAAAIRKLTPIAEGQKKGDRKLDESWLETEDGQAYKDAYTRKVAQQVENIVMDIEAGKSQDLTLKDRMKALQASGMTEDNATDVIIAHGAERRISDMEAAIKDEWDKNGTFEQMPRSIKELKATKEYIPAEEYYRDVYKNYIMQEDGKVSVPDDEKVTEANRIDWRTYLASEYEHEVRDQLTRENEQPVRRSQYQEGELENTTEADMRKMFSQQVETKTKPTPLRSGYSEEELSSSVDDQMEKLMAQINQHMGQGDQGKKPQNEQGQTEGRKQGRKREDRAYGVFEGKEVSFKNSWSTHKFTDDEVQKLLAGETISFDYQNKNDETKSAHGKLEWQEYEGRPFLGFKAEFGKKQEVSQQETSNNLFSDEEMALMYGGGEPSPEEESYYGEDTFFGMDPDEYQRQLEEDMRNYQPEETPYVEGQPELTEQDLEGLTGDGPGMGL